MSTPEPNIPMFTVTQPALRVLAVTVVGAAASLGVVGLMGWSGQIVPCLAAAAVCFIAALISLVIVRSASRVSIQTVAICVTAGSIVRLILCVGGAALLIGALGFDKRPTVLWMLGWYLVILLLEVRIFTRYFQSLSIGSPDASGNTDPDHDVTEVGTCSPAGS